MAVTIAAPERLQRIWETKPGLATWFATVDHKAIGSRYLVTAFTFFLLGGIEAFIMRLQLGTPENTLIGPEAYNQLFSMHGTTMIFFFTTPMLFGFGNYIIPLMLGARDMAFPRLNAFGYWVFILAGIFMYSSFLIGSAPDRGWFAYSPLTERTYSPGPNMDYWALGLIFLGISTTAGAINFIVSIFKLRAPGLSVNRLPLFVWGILVTSFAVIFAFPSLTAGNALLELDRLFGTHFLEATGNVLLWQHLFWWFGHPDVYIMFLPAIGIISTVIPTFARQRIVGHTFVALATVTTGIIAFGVWVHHMFATGLTPLSLSFFSAASVLITIPSGVQIFAWLATIWLGRAVITTPFLFALGFIVLFVMGGVTGVMFAVVPFDQQVTDSYFVVAHFHYVLVGGAIFPVFAGLYYWIPKITGRILDERVGKWTFWTMFIGFNLLYFPMHILGLLGMPRRIYTWQTGLGWDLWNFLSTIGGFVFSFGILLFLFNFFTGLRRGRPAGDNPWAASTLEWATPSPPPYNFRIIPTVTSRDPLWDQETVVDERVLPRPHDEVRETLGTTVLDAEPEEILRMPEDSYWPLLLALALAIIFVGLLIQVPAVWITGVVLSALAVGGWFWPTGATQEEGEHEYA